MIPAAGATLALSAALAAACFVKAFGVTFLGRARTEAAAKAVEVDRFSLAAMFAFAALCLLAGILPGIVIDALAPSIELLLGDRMPVQAYVPWLSIVPIAEGRSSYNGLLVFVFIALSAWIAIYVIHRWASHAVRRSAPWDCGFPDASPATQYTAGSFSQPIRRVFGTVVFRARESVEMPPPGSTQPARYHADLRDLIWDVIYVPVAAAVNALADRLNRRSLIRIHRQFVPTDPKQTEQYDDIARAHEPSRAAPARADTLPVNHRAKHCRRFIPLRRRWNQHEGAA
jgi:hypothetical protein